MASMPVTQLENAGKYIAWVNVDWKYSNNNRDNEHDSDTGWVVS